MVAIIWGGLLGAVAWYLGAFHPPLRGVLVWVIGFAIFHGMWRRTYLGR
jgi:hypothetical protein